MSRADRPLGPRKRPVQARSKVTVDFLLEAAAQVFHREGFGATTNRIAKQAGLSIGTLYEYFPNKHALLTALAERHVALAEHEVRAALARNVSTAQLLSELQRAILESHRFPSQAIELVVTAKDTHRTLLQRATALREEIMSALARRADDLPEPRLRARAVFALIGELTARSLYELETSEHEKFARQMLELAVAHMRA